MSTLRVRKFTDIVEMEFFLRGGILGSTMIAPPALNSTLGTRGVGGAIGGLVGQTLTITTPALALTFVAGADPYFLTFLEIRSQIQGAQALLDVTTVNGRIGLIEASPTTGIVLPNADTGARRLLGLPNQVAFTSLVYGQPGGAAPTFVWAYNANMAGMHVIVTYE